MSTLLAGYSYNALNRRIIENDGTTATRLFYSANWQVLEEQVSGQTTTQYVWSPVYIDAMILRDRDTDSDGDLDERLYVQQDANWNVTALVDALTGNVVQRFVQDPFGFVTVLDSSFSPTADAFDWKYLYQGLRLDVAVGMNLYDGRNRIYDPVLQRWLQVDPICFAAGDSNSYRHLGNRPTVANDPYGMADTLTLGTPRLVAALVAEGNITGLKALLAGGTIAAGTPLYMKIHEEIVRLESEQRIAIPRPAPPVSTISQRRDARPVAAPPQVASSPPIATSPYPAIRPSAPATGRPVRSQTPPVPTYDPRAAEIARQVYQAELMRQAFQAELAYEAYWAEAYRQAYELELAQAAELVRAAEIARIIEDPALRRGWWQAVCFFRGVVPQPVGCPDRVWGQGPTAQAAKRAAIDSVSPGCIGPGIGNYGHCRAWRMG